MNAEAAPPPVMAARAPRSVTDRSSTLDTKSTPAVRTKTDEAPIAAAPRARATPPSAAPPVTTEVGEAAPMPAEGESLVGRDLLGEGLVE
jgi:hypothetical protein